ncbi:hypothetical protein [Shimazuella kribbensis]|uniref:hypothetical protein n=1 Tax=Shimazuella kribbensis TaxID=139808 RepID=UPI00041DC005|nr:hypothetical protein [Shimazuella kribbensis]
MVSTSQTTEKIHPHHESLPQREGFQLFRWLRKGWALNKSLTMLGLMLVITLLATCVGLLVEHRVIAGAPAWAKPAKFAISFSFYCFTFVWLLSYLQRWKKTAMTLTIITFVGVFIDMALIVLQVFRGVQSHFNVATPFDDMVYRIMGLGSTMIFIASLVTGIFLLFKRNIDLALIWSLRLGLVIMILGMSVGFLMTQATQEQLAVFTAGQMPPIFGAHSVGVPDGGPGLPFLGWSTTGGDLRIAHFVGLHALQVLPFLGWFLSAQRFPRFSTRQRIALVWIIGLGYAGLVGSLLWQALRGQSLIAPDGLTWLTWGLIIGVTLILSGAIILRARLSKIQ